MNDWTHYMFIFNLNMNIYCIDLLCLLIVWYFYLLELNIVITSNFMNISSLSMATEQTEWRPPDAAERPGRRLTLILAACDWFVYLYTQIINVLLHSKNAHLPKHMSLNMIATMLYCIINHSVADADKKNTCICLQIHYKQLLIYCL